MNRLRGATLALSAAVAAGAACFVMVSGCSSDTSVQPAGNDSGSDSMADGTTDGNENETGSETGVDADAAAMDTSTGSDAGPDADAAMMMVDSSDGPSPEAEAGIPLGEQFALQEGRVFCQHFLGCCPGADAGAYNVQGCSQTLAIYGWENSLAPVITAYSTGHVNFDPEAGAACLAAIQTIPCTPPGQTAQEWGPVTQTCFSVFTGNGPPGATCLTSWECGPGMYCDNADGGGISPNGGAGQCRALVGQGQPCNNDQMCSYLGSSTNGLYCDLIDFPDGGGATCRTQLAAGANCASANGQVIDDMACQALLCGDNLTCGTNLAAPYPAFCNAWPAIQDAGGGG